MRRRCIEKAAARTPCAAFCVINDSKPRGLLHDADDVKTALLFAVDLAEEPKIGPNIGKAVFGGFVRSEGQDEILDAVAVDVLNRHLLSRGAILVEIDIRVRIGHAEDEGKLFKNPISERWGKQICLNKGLLTGV